ncbi:histone deacetylase HDT2 isoform X2 [Sorghum bicolor]|uniref:histone deacetylase HDT2 isoform X2 n=1 Tax=Sorghum bicolor TaxID=4558 RepID=UPI000B426901|nr:histone deacetylase HDT2 isoform X2 [Sorghum bicolor]|eukprot:XP_021305986.1 histone deacetylase HDT2 isoform X2 [Sorghum bicolor]
MGGSGGGAGQRSGAHLTHAGAEGENAYWRRRDQYREANESGGLVGAGWQEARQPAGKPEAGGARAAVPSSPVCECVAVSSSAPREAGRSTRFGCSHQPRNAGSPLGQSRIRIPKPTLGITLLLVSGTGTAPSASLTSRSQKPRTLSSREAPRRREAAGRRSRTPSRALLPRRAMPMVNGIFEYWGVVVRPGATVKCDPGEFYCHVSQIALQDSKGNEDVRVFVKADGKKFLIGTLSVDKYPQYTTSLVFEKEFELLHTSKTSTISALGYKFSETSTEEGDESNEEVPQAIPLYPNADDDKSKESKCGVEKPAATESSKSKVSLEEAKVPDKHKADVGGDDNDESDEDVDSEDGESGDDESSSDEDDGESSNEDDDEDSPKSTKRNNRPAETPLKTPPGKKARITTPSMGKKSVSDDAKRSNHVHVATPYPSSKQVKTARSIIDNSKQSTGYACKSCSKTFYSSVGLETHCKVKHSACK